jgi:hypothetical protein
VEAKLGLIVRPRILRLEPAAVVGGVVGYRAPRKNHLSIFGYR